MELFNRESDWALMGVLSSVHSLPSVCLARFQFFSHLTTLNNYFCFRLTVQSTSLACLTSRWVLTTRECLMMSVCILVFATFGGRNSVSSRLFRPTGNFASSPTSFPIWGVLLLALLVTSIFGNLLCCVKTRRLKRLQGFSPEIVESAFHAWRFMKYSWTVSNDRSWSVVRDSNSAGHPLTPI